MSNSCFCDPSGQLLTLLIEYREWCEINSLDEDTALERQDSLSSFTEWLDGRLTPNHSQEEE